MQKINFLSLKYRKKEPEQNNILVGICDPIGENPAYTTTDINNPDKWIARIVNEDKKKFLFVPIDKNIIILRDNGDKEKSCDGMILFGENSICFVELKDKNVSGWLSEAIAQLKSTILIFNQNHHYEDFPIREAYAANCVHPRFQNSCRERLTEFRNKTYFKLLPKAAIKL